MPEDNVTSFYPAKVNAAGFQVNGSDVTEVYGTGGADFNGDSLILDADGDTSITADTDDQIDIEVAGADDFQITANTLTALTGSTIAVADADKLTVGGVIVPQNLIINAHCETAADCTDRTIFVANAAYQVTGCSATFSTAETTAANLRVQLTKDTSTDAPGAGTDLLTNNSNNGISCKGTANTPVAGTLTGTAANLQLASGNRLAIDFEAAATELAGFHITVYLKRI